MSHSRFTGRMLAVQALFQEEFNRGNESVLITPAQSKTTQETLEYLLEERGAKEYDSAFARGLIQGVAAHIGNIDEIIGKHIKSWSVERIMPVDRAILHIALYEMLFADDRTPPKVVISESIELAKAFSGESSAKFINGLLAAVLAEKQAEGLL